jgi:hypothetical protein
MEERERYRRGSGGVARYSVKLPRTALSGVVFLSLAVPQCRPCAAAFQPVLFLSCAEPGSGAVLTWISFCSRCTSLSHHPMGP